MANEGQGCSTSLFNYSEGNLNALETLHNSDDILMGLSDAGAHCGAICDGGMPTFMLTHWARDRSRGAKIPLERIIQRQTRDTARGYGLMDRGVLAPGYKADVNVIDFERLTLETPRLMWDLPAGGRRLLQRARGYAATICSGTVISPARRIHWPKAGSTHSRSNVHLRPGRALKPRGHSTVAISRKCLPSLRYSEADSF